MTVKHGLAKWVAVLVVLFIGSCCIIGPSRFYGYARAVTIIATVNNICGLTGSDKETFAIELQTDAGEIYTVTSRERIWGVIAKGDYIRVKLYPTAPWSLSDGCWINARLLNKLVKKK